MQGVVVEAFDRIDDVEAGIGARWIAHPIHAFDLQRPEEAFHRSASQQLPLPLLEVSIQKARISARQDLVASWLSQSACMINPGPGLDLQYANIEASQNRAV